jgi:hypothetical protein
MNNVTTQLIAAFCGLPLFFVAIGFGLCEFVHRIEIRRRANPWGKP